MNRLILLFTIILHALCTAYGQKIFEINRTLDSVPYYNITDIDYTKNLEVSEAVKRRVMDILNGYLPPQIIKEFTQISDQVATDISDKAWHISGTDSTRYIHIRDSLLKKYQDNRLNIYKTQAYPENLILAIGSWGIKEAIPILRSNLDNPRFPKVATLLALSKLGDNGSKDSVMKLLEVKDTVFTEIMPRGYISEQRYQLIKAGNYLQDKAILSRIVDLLDVEGKAILFDRSDAVPSELLTILELSLCFIERKYIDNNSLYKWEGLTDQFFNEINHNLNNLQALKTILSEENKLRVKSQLKSWIDKYVVFE